MPRTRVPLPLPTPTKQPIAEELTSSVPSPPLPPPPPPPAQAIAVQNQSQSRQQREWDRDEQSLSRSITKLCRFDKNRCGGLRAEAHVVFNNNPLKNTPVESREVAHECLNDGLQAALFATDSRSSGLWANAVVSHKVSTELVDCAMLLAKSRRGREDRGLYLQAAVNQLGQSGLVDSVSRKLVSDGIPLQRILRLLKEVNDIQHGPFCLPSSSSRSFSDGVAFLVRNLDSTELALAETVMRHNFEEEKLLEGAARGVFATSSSVQLHMHGKSTGTRGTSPAAPGRCRPGAWNSGRMLLCF
jgi:hypothetical protein